MNSYKFGVTGQERKSFAGAISELTNSPVKYLGAPTFAYEIGGYHIDKAGTVTGEYDPSLFAALAECGYKPESEKAFQLAGVPSAPETLAEETPGEPAPGADPPVEPADRQPGSGRLTIEMPLDGFTPESLDNLTKMVSAKETLLKKALGVDELPIRVLADRIAFPWFRFCDNDDLNAYAQFICALCATAKEKSAYPQRRRKPSRTKNSRSGSG